jgi:hypothetical protein
LIGFSRVQRTRHGQKSDLNATLLASRHQIDPTLSLAENPLAFYTSSKHFPEHLFAFSELFTYCFKSFEDNWGSAPPAHEIVAHVACQRRACSHGQHTSVWKGAKK